MIINLFFNVENFIIEFKLLTKFIIFIKNMESCDEE